MVGATPPEKRIEDLQRRLGDEYGATHYWRSQADFWSDLAMEAHLVVRLGLARALRDMRRTPEGRTYARMIRVHIQRERRAYRAAETEAAA